MSAETRPTIAPTVRHAMRISSVTAVLEHCVASHATVFIEVAGVPDSVTRPRHRDHRRAVHPTVHPRRVGLDEHPHGPNVQRSPPPAALTPIEPRRSPTAPTTTPPSTLAR